MAEKRIRGPLGRTPASDLEVLDHVAGNQVEPGTIGDDETELDETPRVKKVTKDWTDPPNIKRTNTPTIGGKSLKAALAELEELSEWGSGGGDIGGTGARDPVTKKRQIEAKPTGKKGEYSVALKGTFFITLPKWKHFNKATQAQKTAWNDMIALLKIHEDEHAMIAFRHAEQLAVDLIDMDVMLAGQAVVDSDTAANDESELFDSAAQTNHGHQAFGEFPKVILDTSSDPPEEDDE